MSSISLGDTICAVATPPGHGGIGVVRVSGPGARAVLEGIWAGKVPAGGFEPRRLYLGEARGIDRAMAVFMPGPATYTGEDVVEISCHGSPVLLTRLIAACQAAGARAAGPGEFTRRAFMAGKLDLAQAEGVGDLIAATNERAASLASDQLKGRLSKEIEAIGQGLADLRAEIEAALDFPEEGLEIPERADILRRLDRAAEAIEALRRSHDLGRVIRDGARVAIAGRPNAGKSSLFNRLVGHDRAIVHSEPGTTRDVVEEAVAIEGMTFKLRDTAGLRPGPNEVEAIGVARAREEIAGADIVIALFDGSRAFAEGDAAILAGLNPARTIAVKSKSDLPRALDPAPIRKWAGRDPIVASAVTGDGLEEITARLVECAAGKADLGEGAIIASARHKGLLDEAARAVALASEAIEGEEPLECAASRLADAQGALGQITGEVTTEEMLDRIFSKFCVGK